MPLTEPTTLVTNWALAAVAVTLGSRLRRAGAGQEDRRAQRLWAAAFLTGAAGALAGGIVHGFSGTLSLVAHSLLWTTVLVCCGVASSAILAGTVIATSGVASRRAFLAGAAGQLAVYLALVSGRADIRLAVWNGVVTIVAVLALALGAAVQDAPRLAWILLALGLSGAGLAAQQARVAAAVLNHNDVCHVLQAAALWPFYRAGLRLHERQSESA